MASFAKAMISRDVPLSAVVAWFEDRYPGATVGLSPLHGAAGWYNLSVQPGNGKGPAPRRRREILVETNMAADCDTLARLVQRSLADRFEGGISLLMGDDREGEEIVGNVAAAFAGAFLKSTLLDPEIWASVERVDGQRLPLAGFRDIEKPEDAAAALRVYGIDCTGALVFNFQRILSGDDAPVHFVRGAGFDQRVASFDPASRHVVLHPSPAMNVAMANAVVAGAYRGLDVFPHPLQADFAEKPPLVMSPG